MIFNVDATGWRLVGLLALDAVIFVSVCAVVSAVFDPPKRTPTQTTIVCVEGSPEESAQVSEESEAPTQTP